MALFNDDELATLKHRYEEDYETAVFANAPTAGLVRKKALGGDSVGVTVKYGLGPGMGARLGTLSDATSTKRLRFTCTPGTLYAQEVVDLVADLASAKDADAVINVFADAQKSCLEACGQLMERCLQGDGSGTDAVVLSHTGTTAAGSTMTLTRPTDAYRFFVGNILAAKATPFAASLDTGTYLVTGVDQIKGILTVTPQGGASVAIDTHYIGLANSVAASTDVVMPVGIPGWLTNDATALAASFYGVVRNVDQVHLAGNVVDCTDQNVLQAVQTVITQIGNIENAKPDTVLLGPSNYNKLMALTTDMRRYCEVKGGDIDVNYAGFSFKAGGRDLTVHQSPFVYANYIEVLEVGKWIIGSPNGGDPFMPAFKGEMFHNLEGTDQAVIRMRGLFTVYTVQPSAHGIAIVSP